MGVLKHRQAAPSSVGVGILSVSTTRVRENDESGLWMVRRAKKEGHDVRFHQVVADDITAIRDAALRAIRNHGLQALLITGGTGITSTDVTIEAIKTLVCQGNDRIRGHLCPKQLRRD
jgi:molybdenum cofactor biosynthesis protein B